MLRDIKSLHLITQKALTTKNGNNNKYNFDSENEKKKPFFIDDNSEIPGIITKSLEKINENYYIVRQQWRKL